MKSLFYLIKFRYLLTSVIVTLQYNIKDDFLDLEVFTSILYCVHLISKSEFKLDKF